MQIKHQWGILELESKIKSEEHDESNSSLLQCIDALIIENKRMKTQRQEDWAEFGCMTQTLLWEIDDLVNYFKKESPELHRALQSAESFDNVTIRALGQQIHALQSDLAASRATATTTVALTAAATAAKPATPPDDAASGPSIELAAAAKVKAAAALKKAATPGPPPPADSASGPAAPAGASRPAGPVSAAQLDVGSGKRKRPPAPLEEGRTARPAGDDEAAPHSAPPGRAARAGCGDEDGAPESGRVPPARPADMPAAAAGDGAAGGWAGAGGQGGGRDVERGRLGMAREVRDGPPRPPPSSETTPPPAPAPAPAPGGEGPAGCAGGRAPAGAGADAAGASGGAGSPRRAAPPAAAPVRPLEDRLWLLEADVARGDGGGRLANPALWGLYYFGPGRGLALRFRRLRRLPPAAARAVRLRLVVGGAVVERCRLRLPAGGPQGTTPGPERSPGTGQAPEPKRHCGADRCPPPPPPPTSGGWGADPGPGGPGGAARGWADGGVEITRVTRVDDPVATVDIRDSDDWP
jgi:hypothetical protein